jgi:hypothetical protein
MEAQGSHPSVISDDGDYMSGVVPTGSVTNSAPEVDVRLSPDRLIRSLTDTYVEQR